MDHHLISDKSYRETVDSAFIRHKSLAAERKDALFNVFNRKLTADQSEGLKFILAFMPLSDLADYTGEFFLENVKIALKTRERTTWGDSIPGDIFLHYVLPCRVNNENLDSFRLKYHNEISERIKGLDMADAALEINHWCHEKVTYQPSDIRTSGPMSTILSARGRCGEESTFTVSALRAAGIPARQVYTPRWAHTDDNHAWVEVWIKGKWHYMGACEPEPVLDRGWFTEPARRAMLIHTRSFGAGYGDENYINKFRLYSEVNNLSSYASTKRIWVKVTDAMGKAVPDAYVEYKLYNYAEFYPLTTVMTDTKGLSSFETGFGDLLIWARKGNDFAFGKISVTDVDTLRLSLNDKPPEQGILNLDLSVPPVPSPFKGPSKELVAMNTKRVNAENKTREAYTDSWIKPGEAKAIAVQLNTDTARIVSLIKKSMGNYREIIAFLKRTSDNDRELAISLLGSIAEKDLRDTKASVLEDHLKNVKNPYKLDTKSELFVNYILNPRVANEMLVAYREYLLKNLPADLSTNVVKDPLAAVKYINTSIKITDDENYYRTPLTPRGTYDLKIADPWSRCIFFVSACRSLGIPSRLEPGSNRPQYFLDGKWNDVYFNDESKPVEMKGHIRLFSGETNPVPEYYVHFTLARLENGRYNTLEYPDNMKITDFRDELELTAGNYMLVTGNRLNDGGVLSGITFFNLAPDKHLKLEVKLRKASGKPLIEGTLDKNALDRITEEGNCRNSGKGAVLAWIEPEREPTKHFLNDLPLLKDEFDKWGGCFIFLSTASGTDSVLFNPRKSNGLPSNSYSRSDIDPGILESSGLKDLAPTISYPLIILVDNDGNIVYSSSGYKIGIAQQILKNIRLLTN
ncbi:MAG: transglutaminase domain-containing protein [Bacteroidota bacterium]|nr:transglutaminase domain-containing protein [Bacteroidota bacterium]